MELQTTPTEGPLSVDGAAAALAAAREQSASEPPKQEKAPPPDYEPANVEAEAEAPEAEEVEAATEEDAPEVETEEDTPPAPAIEPPRSWSKEDREVWAKVPREVQEIVAKREADRDKAINVAASQAGQLNAVLRDMDSKYQSLASNLKGDWQRRWGDVDWVRMAREYTPEEYNHYRAQAEQELADLKAAEAESARVAAAARQAFLAEEGKRLAEISPELADPEKGKERRQKTAEYLVKQGFEASILGDISAVELTIAHKAMLWDEAQADAKRKAALPRKVAPIPAGKPVKPSGQGAVSPQRELQGLETKLTKVGKGGSLSAAYDVAAELMAARRAQQQRGQRS